MPKKSFVRKIWGGFKHMSKIYVRETYFDSKHASNFLILSYLLKQKVFRAETDPGALTELCRTVINDFQSLAVN